MSDCRFGVSLVNYPDPDPERILHERSFHMKFRRRAYGEFLKFHMKCPRVLNSYLMTILNCIFSPLNFTIYRRSFHMKVMRRAYGEFHKMHMKCTRVFNSVHLMTVLYWIFIAFKFYNCSTENALLQKMTSSNVNCSRLKGILQCTLTIL